MTAMKFQPYSISLHKKKLHCQSIVFIKKSFKNAIKSQVKKYGRNDHSKAKYV